MNAKFNEKQSPFTNMNSASNGEKPLVSFVLFAYNQEKYICDAVKGALDQAYEPMEIIISDDCSSDNTYDHILKMIKTYCGPHKVTARRNKTNLGFTAHISEVMGLVNGQLIISADGDDVSYPHRTTTVVEQWLINNHESGSILSLYDIIMNDKSVAYTESKYPPLRYTIGDRDLGVVKSCCVGTLGCALAWTKDVFQVFGELDSRSIHQDITIPLRSLLLGSVTFIQEPLVLYRFADNTLSRMTYKTSAERSLKMKRYWAARIANYDQFDRDMHCALMLGMVDLEDAKWTEGIVNSQRELAVLNHAFFSSNTLQKIKALLFSSWGLPIGRRIKLMFLTIFPWLYVYSANKAMLQIKFFKQRLMS